MSCDRRMYKWYWKCGVWLLFFWMAFVTAGDRTFICYAKDASMLPSGVCSVSDEEELIISFIKGMKKHKSTFSYYYPGIKKDFLQYQKRGYRGFFDKVSKKNGYLMGIVSGSCVTICGEAPAYVSIQVCYLTTKGQEKKIDKTVKRIVKKLGTGSRVTRILRAHDYLIQNMHYDSRFYSPYQAFMKGRGMCMAYALAFQRIMQEMKIPCLYVKGRNHAWNMVKVGKRWYNVDVTWDDSNSTYRYFLKCDRDFPGHKRPESILYKDILKAKHSYPLHITTNIK